MTPGIRILRTVPHTSEINIRCCGCGHRHNAHPKLVDMAAYWDGATVQEVWPNESAEYREVMMGYRTGWFICPACDEPNSAKEVTDV